MTMLKERLYDVTIRETRQMFLERLVGHEGDKCVIWPFSRDQDGYANCMFNGVIGGAHRFMCELVHGPAPSRRYEAAHSCGNGHNACVNPNHLSWKTTIENKIDTVDHGNGKKRGDPRRKLSDAQVQEIRGLKGRKTYREIAAMYGVHHRTIGLIITGHERPDRPKNHRNAIPAHQRTEMAKRAKVLLAEGKSYRNVALELGCSRGTVKTLAAG